MKTYMTVLATIMAIVSIMGGVLIYRAFINSSPERYFNRGKKNYDIAQFEEAVNDFTEYLAIEMPNGKTKPKQNLFEAQFLIASSLQKLKKSSIAKERLILIINNPEFSEYATKAILEYGNIIRIDNDVDYYLVGQLEKYLKMPNDPITQSAMNMLYGYQLLFMKKYGEALSYFLRSDGELATLGRARVYFAMNEYNRAFEVYEDFIKYYPSSEYFTEVVRTYLIQVPAYAHKLNLEKDYAKARYYYEKIATLFPRRDVSEDALFNIAKIYYEQKNYTKTIEYCNRVRINNVGTLDAEALLYIGISYFKMDRYKESYKALNSFITEYAANPNVPQAKEYLKALQEIMLTIN